MSFMSNKAAVESVESATIFPEVELRFCQVLAVLTGKFNLIVAQLTYYKMGIIIGSHSVAMSTK